MILYMRKKLNFWAVNMVITGVDVVYLITPTWGLAIPIDPFYFEFYRLFGAKADVCDPSLEGGIGGPIP